MVMSVWGYLGITTPAPSPPHTFVGSALLPFLSRLEWEVREGHASDPLSRAASPRIYRLQRWGRELPRRLDGSWVLKLQIEFVLPHPRMGEDEGALGRPR